MGWDSASPQAIMWSKYERSVLIFKAKPWLVILLLTLIPIEAIFLLPIQTPVGLLTEVDETLYKDILMITSSAQCVYIGMFK